MKIAIIGAGPAGLTSAKQALDRGHAPTVFERYADVGGIWNPASGGAYPSVRMQSSRLSFPFSDFPPQADTGFLSLAQVHDYLARYSENFGVKDRIVFNAEVTKIEKRSEGWSIVANGRAETFDAVMVATGELWQPRRLPQPVGGTPRMMTAKDYTGPSGLAGYRVLVVGGGVSGADIAAELGTAGIATDWAVRRKAQFLPRMCAEYYNDELFSYAGRIAVGELTFDEYLALLDQIVPDHMAACRRTGMLPDPGFHNAVHINDAIVPALDRGDVNLRPAFRSFAENGDVEFANESRGSYDVVIQCLGYDMPDYSFIDSFDRTDLYEHFIYRHDPTLAVVNTPVDTEAFGTACPYFETIVGWILRVWDGEIPLPTADEMRAWCEMHMGDLDNRRHYDCWLETLRLGLANKTLPDPWKEFRAYWNLVSGPLDPARLSDKRAAPMDCAYDDPAVLESVRLRILASFSPDVLARLLKDGEISEADIEKASGIDKHRQLQPWLPYRMR